jgi:hypothetical protein
LEVAGDRSQFGIGPRRERVFHPEVELVFGQPLLYERVLEQFDHSLAVGPGRAEIILAPASCPSIPA